jgi:hypothetical protein
VDKATTLAAKVHELVEALAQAELELDRELALQEVALKGLRRRQRELVKP